MDESTATQRSHAPVPPVPPVLPVPPVPPVSSTPRAVVAAMAAKVPEVTLLFWVTKILTTGMGESTSDFLVNRIGPAGAVGLSGVALAGSLTWQLRADRYVAWIYWLAVSMVAVFGTLAADGVHVGLGVPYYVSTAVYGLILAGILIAWYRREGTLSIHSIYTLRREKYYWATVFATFALGTAAGDMTAVSLHWGYLSSGVAFAAAIAVPAIVYWRTSVSPIVVFWSAYVLTRPLGASFADWLGKRPSLGGVGLGDGTVALLGAIVIAGLVAVLARTHTSAGAERLAPQPQE
jgi:uncharacterized membrane-anchored protein